MANYTDPFSQLDDFARHVFGATPSGSSRTPRFMPMDLYKAGETYVLTADLPGVDPESIDIDIDNGVLTISAKRSTTPEEESVAWINNERFSGSFRRKVTLSDSVDTESISADYASGVLTVTLPVAEKAKARKIQVSHTEATKEIDA